MRLTLDFGKSVDENAALFFEASKKSRKKNAGVKKALSSLSERIGSARSAQDAVTERAVQKRRKRDWFEKFRWFYSSDGLLVIGGRDAKSNEQLIKKFLAPEDLFVHADVFGAPHCVVKSEKKPISERTKQEAALFAAVFSRSWEAGSNKADVYAAQPDQVSKAAPTGESIGKGAFMVYGEREWFRNVDLRIAVGFEERPDGFRIVSGPLSAVKTRTAQFVELAPGATDKNAVAKQVLALLRTKSGISLPDSLLDEVLGMIPNGSSRVLSKTGESR